jgi:uncharacterized protein
VAALLNPAPCSRARSGAVHRRTPTWQNPEERFFFQPAFVDELGQLASDIRRLAPSTRPRPSACSPWCRKGDEVLDWREMMAFCAGGTIRLLPDGDHAISDFEAHIDALFGFLRPLV